MLSQRGHSKLIILIIQLVSQKCFLENIDRNAIRVENMETCKIIRNNVKKKDIRRKNSRIMIKKSAGSG